MFKSKAAFSGFSVDDIAKAKAFYSQKLGVGVEETPQGLELKIPNGPQVFLYPKPNHEPATFTVLNFIVDNIESAVADLKAAGVEFEHYDYPGLKTDPDGIARDDRGPKIAWFKDPANNILSVLQPPA